MADPVNPTNSTRSTSTHSSQEIHQREQMTNDANLARCALIAGNLKVKRAEMLQSFSDEQKEKVSAIEQCMDCIRQLYMKYMENSNPQEKREIKEEIQIKQTELRELFELAIPKSPKSAIPRIEPSWDNPSIEHFQIYEEGMLSPIYNRIAYRNEILQNIENNRDLLQQEFGIPPNARIAIQFLSGETHNQGKLAVKIACFKDGDIENRNSQNIKMFVYKPRDARIDQAVITTFRTINNLPPEKKSSPILLPEYQIVNLQGNTASFWEFIPGQNLHKPKQIPESAGHYVSNLKDGPLKEELKQKLVRLDDVLSAMYVSDLHGSNIIIKKNSDASADVVPIDLENVYISPSSLKTTKLNAEAIRTELEQHNQYQTFNLKQHREEKQAIKTFVQQSKEMVVRYVPVGGTSGSLKHVSSWKNADLFIQSLKNELERDNIEFIGADDQIKDCFFNNALQEDCPFFTEINGIIYYGTPEEKIPIGKRRK